MNYKEIFEVAYSTKISEKAKDIVFEKLCNKVEISESEVNPQVEACLEVLDSLIYSTASKELMENIIDEMFYNASEEFINEISAEFVRKKAEDALAKRRMAHIDADYKKTVAKNDLKDAMKDAHSNKEGWIDKVNKAEGEYNKASQNLENAKNRVNRAKKLMNYGKPTLKDKIGNAANAVKDNASKVGGAIKSGASKVANAVKTNAPKVASTAVGKLKSVAGKVKDWYNKVNAPKEATYKDYARAIAKKAEENVKAGKSALGDDYSRGSSKISAPTTTTSTTSAPTSKKTTSTNINSAPKASTTSGAGTISKPSSSSSSNIKVKNSAIDTTTKTSEPKQSPAVAEAPKAEGKKTRTRAKKVETAEAPKEETTQMQLNFDSKGKEETSTSKDDKKTTGRRGRPPKTTKTSEPKQTPAVAETPEKEEKVEAQATPTEKTDKNSRSAAKEIKADVQSKPKLPREEREALEKHRQAYEMLKRKLEQAEKDPMGAGKVQDIKDRMAVVQGKINKFLGESLALLLLKTNISEASFVDIMEAVGAHDKETALKILNRNEQRFNDALDACYKSFTEGKPVNKEAMKGTERLGKRLDSFRKIYKKRFGDS
jgi:hypothetical protein